MCWSSLADQEFNNIQVVVMDCHMKGCQTVLLNTHTHTHFHIYKPMNTTKTHRHMYIWNTHHDISSLCRLLTALESVLYCFCTSGSTDCLTLPAALGLAPLSRRSSATSTFPYLEATWRGVKPFCSKERKKQTRKQKKMLFRRCWLILLIECLSHASSKSQQQHIVYGSQTAHTLASSSKFTASFRRKDDWQHR